MRQTRIGILLALLIVLVTPGGPLFAQVKSSAITGSVTDQSGAVVPDAKVTVTETATGTTNATQTNGKGEYTVPYLPIGHYTVEVVAPGFQTSRKTDIDLGGGVTAREDISMAVGNTTATVDVKADALVIQTESATVGSAVNSEVIQNQANITGNSLYFATLDSGVVGNPNQLLSSNLGVGYLDRRNMSGLRINGGEIGSNDVQLDGNSIQGAAWHETAVLPNPDALSEVRVITNNFTADVGLAQGVIQQTTKGGTNAFHGDVNFMIRNEDLNANSFSNNHQFVQTGSAAFARPKYRLLQGGGAIGGPIIIPHLYNGKDKLFFFASFLRLTHSTSNGFSATVPTALERTGDFSQTFVRGNSGAPVLVNIYNPFTATAVAGSNNTQFVRTQYPGNKVTNPSPFGLKILQGYPLPTSLGQDAFHTNNYTYVSISPEARNSLNTRFDYKFRSNQSIYFTAGISKGYITNPNNWGTNAGDTWINQQGSNAGNVVDRNPYGAIGDTVVINPTTVLDVRYGVTRIDTQAQVPSAIGDPTKYGQPAFVAAVAPFGPNNLPGIPAITPYSQLNNNNFGNKKEHQLNHSINGSLTKVKGNLTMKFGTEYRVYLQNWQDIQWQSPPITTTNYTAQFAGPDGLAIASLNPQNQNLGFAPAAILSGAEGWSLAPGGSPITAIASKYIAFYSQNNWRATKKLLLSLGIRYEVQPGPTERFNRMSSYVLDKPNPFATGSFANPKGGLGFLTFPGVGGYSRNLYETTWNNVSPRLGVTYQLTDKTVLRGGYGRNYLPSNTGYNANTTIYNPTPWDTAVNAIPYGLAPSGLPVGTFDQPTNTLVIPGALATQSAANYGQPSGVTIFNRTLYKTGHTDQWNFFIERQITPTWIANVGYVGSMSGTLPWRGFLINGPFSVDPAQLAAWRNTWVNSNGTNDQATARVANPIPALIGKAPGASGGATISALQNAEPYVGSLGVTNFESVGSSAYHAFILKVQHSTSHGFSFSGNYTWSKATGLVGNSGTQTFAESQSGTSSGPTGGVDYVNLQNNHSILNYDIPNRLVFNLAYALPFGKGRAFNPGNWVVRDIIGGWEVTSAVNLQAGYPWGPLCSANGTTYTQTLNGRCNRVAGQPLELPKSAQRYYNGSETLTLPDGRIITPAVNSFMKWNPDAWTAPTVTFANGKSAVDQYTMGTSALAYSNMRTPGIQNVNLSVIKRFPINERVGLDLHVNATNAFNHTNHTFSSNTGTTANNLVTPITAANAATNTVVGQNGNASFGSWGLNALENRQLVVQANITF